MTLSDLHNLRIIVQRLKSFHEMLGAMDVSHETRQLMMKPLTDEIDWLECFISKQRKHKDTDE